MAVFAACFPGKTCALPSSVFQQMDPTHFVLDVTSTVSPQHTDLKEISLFLTAPNALPPDAALGLYVSVGGSDWAFRGYIANAHPSDVVPLSWPDPPDGAGAGAGAPGWAKIGVSLEPLAEASDKEGAKLGAKEDFCRRVGMDLFNFMQSFGGVARVGPDQLLVPANVLDQWFNRISSRLKRDPDWLTRSKEVV